MVVIFPYNPKPQEDFMKKFFLFTFLLLFSGLSYAQNLIITGVVDGPLEGGTPKAIEFYAINNISDLSHYAFGVANNGDGSDGPEFQFPSESISAGAFIYVATEQPYFNTFFGFDPNYISGHASINGDDAVELFYDISGEFSGSETAIDVFGDINTDGTGEDWDYVDGWAYRNDNSGPDGATFNLANWSFSGTNALDEETSNTTATSPFPIGTYSHSLTTLVQFTTSSNSVSEDDGTYNLTLSIQNEDAAATTCEVVLSSGDTEDIENYTTQTVTFPGGSSDNQTVTITITDDAGYEGNEVLTFEIQNVSGGNSASPGAPNTFELTILDNDLPPTPAFVITEILADPAADLAGDANADGVRETYNDEFVEIINHSGSEQNISDWTLSDNSSIRHTFPNPTIVPNGTAIVVFGGGSPTGSFGGSLVQTASSGGLSLNNTDDSVILKDASDNVITEYTYGSEAGDNQSIARDPELTGEFVKHSEAIGTGGALFSPGTKLDGSAYQSTTSIATQPASNVYAAFATLNANVNPNGLETMIWFEIGTVSGGPYVAINAQHSAGSGSTDTTLSYTIANLTPDQDYFYRAVAENSSGTYYGLEVYFATPMFSGRADGATGFSVAMGADYSYELQDSDGNTVIAFENVTSGGNLTGLVENSIPPLAPVGYNNAPRYWTVEFDGATSAYTIQLDLTGILGISDFNALKVFKRPTGADALAWVDVSLLPGVSVSYNDPFIVVSGLTTFSDFTIAGSGDNTLAVELITFTGKNTSNGVELNWRTSSETDNKGFILFRDGVEIASHINSNDLKGQGTTSLTTRYSYLDKSVGLGAHVYSLRSEDFSGLIHNYNITVNIEVKELNTSTLESEYALSQNYPNPFNPSTNISFSMKKAGAANIQVFDLLGREVQTMKVNAKKGKNVVSFNASTLTSGIYFYQMKAEGFTSRIQRMILIK